MELSEEAFDELESYLDGTMPEAERGAFEARLAADTALREEVATQRALRRALRVQAFKHELQQARERQEGTAQTAPTERQGRVLRPRWGLPTWQTYAVAASVAVLLLAGVWFWRSGGFQSPEQRAFNEFYRPEDRVRGECPSDLPAFERYAARDYASALAEVSTQADDSTRCLAYFRGLNHLGLDQAAEAVVQFTDALRSSERSVRVRAEWYLALAYLQGDQPGEARRLLARIAGDEDAENPYRARARRILDDHLSD